MSNLGRSRNGASLRPNQRITLNGTEGVAHGALSDTAICPPLA